MTFFYFLFIHFLINFFSSNLGFFFLKLKKNLILQSLLNLFLGFSLLIIITSFSYLVFGLDIINIILLILILSICVFFYNLKEYKLLFKTFLTLVCLNLPFIIFFTIIALINGEQYYSFRGNHWDYLNYVTSSYAISEFDLNYIKENINIIQSNFPFSKMGWLLHIQIRPSINIFLSIFMKLDLKIYT